MNKENDWESIKAFWDQLNNETEGYVLIFFSGYQAIPRHAWTYRVQLLIHAMQLSMLLVNYYKNALHLKPWLKKNKKSTNYRLQGFLLWFVVLCYCLSWECIVDMCIRVFVMCSMMYYQTPAGHPAPGPQDPVSSGMGGIASAHGRKTFL